jgi:hypothetical protein
VVLRDERGQVVHQLTAEEFIALRRNRKILDRKL